MIDKLKSLNDLSFSGSWPLKFFVDLGYFYTKVYIMDMGEEDKFSKRSFFPTMAQKSSQANEEITYYQHNDIFYSVGYDCPDLDIMALTKDPDECIEHFILSLKKIIFDNSFDNSQIELNIVIDDGEKLEKLRELEILQSGPHTFKAFNTINRQHLSKLVTMDVNFISADFGLIGYLKKENPSFKLAALVDIGYYKSKVYIIHPQKGVEHFNILDIGVSDYYQSLIKKFLENDVHNIELYYFIKQIEVGYRKVEISEESDGLVFDISSVIDNLRWDLNKDLNIAVSDFITSYYNNTTNWVDTLAIMGGGAQFNGEILASSLSDAGLNFNWVTIEKHPMYNILKGIYYTILDRYI